MKKMKKVLLGIMAIVACLFISVSVNAANGKVVKLKPNKTYKCDITGDGKLDKLKFKLTTASQWNKNVDIYVNGKNVYKKKGGQPTEIYGCTVELITLENKKSFLYIATDGVNDTNGTWILQYKNGRMKEIIDFSRVYGRCGWGAAYLPKVVGNKLVVDYTLFSNNIGIIGTRIAFVYKNGTLKKASSTDDFNSRVKVYTARKNIKLYSKVGSKEVSFVLKKGQKLVIDKMRVKGRKCYYRGTSKGRRGWFVYNCEERPSYENRPFEEIIYGG